MKTLGDFKRGDTFAFYANLKDKITGDPITVEQEFIKCQVRNPSGKLYAELTVTKVIETPGRYYFTTSKEVTKIWPASVVGVELHIDIEFEINGVSSSTDTFSVNVIQDVTKEV